MSSEPILRRPWYRSTLAIALFGSLLLWAALPPLALGWLGWIAPVPWLLLVRADELPGRRPYRSLWLAGLVFWLFTIHWLRLPHPAVYIGWVALSAYLAIYLPVFVGLSRVAVHRVRLPLWIAAPVVWTGLELARAHLLTGFLMASLAHTQVKWTAMIQVSDIFGEYGVDFVVMLVASCVASLFRISTFGLKTEPNYSQTTSKPLVILPAVIVLSGTLLYGFSRLNPESESTRSEAPTTIRIALIQGNSLADWKMDTGKQRQIMEEYIGLSKQAVEKAKALNDGRPIDLVVWPETMYRNPLREFEEGYKSPEGVDLKPEEVIASDKRMLADLTSYLGAPILVGIDRVRFLADDASTSGKPPYEAYNSAALIDASGQVVGTYDKYHLVMFGEYVPFARWLPVLNRMSSITGSVLAGEGPVALCTGGVCYSPNICYETVIPHVIRRHVTSADVLVNMTNDAWYWGSSELDQHLACGVFRAVETRKPLVIAANGGLSAWIDHTGKIREQSPRQQPFVILADVEPSNMQSLYMRFGDWFAGLCLTFCVVLAIIGWFNRPSPQPQAPSP